MIKKFKMSEVGSTGHTHCTLMRYCRDAHTFRRLLYKKQKENDAWADTERAVNSPSDLVIGFGSLRDECIHTKIIIPTCILKKQPKYLGRAFLKQRQILST